MIVERSTTLGQFRAWQARSSLPNRSTAVAQASSRAPERGHLVLEWAVAGRTVTLVCARAPVAGISRIGLVWTDVDHRGRGYGAAVTAAAATAVLASVARDVCLFADVANPGSHRLYARLGFVAVARHRTARIGVG